jgi:BON domain-containing protein
MADTLFGSLVPMWSAMPAPALGWFQPPVPIANRPIGPVLSGITNTQTAPNGGTLTADPFGFTGGIMPGQVAPGFPSVFAGPIPGASLPMVGPPDMGANSAAALVAAVAMRRGQPLGPTNDQEIEEFMSDALDLLPGAHDVEIRCEGGRVSLTGSIQQKRLKRDVGEIAWSIPGINDVQNNVTITPRRRSRSSTRESEVPSASAGPPRKQP